MTIFTFFVLGLIFGSFINSVVYRLEKIETLWERSHCPRCKKQIRWHDNIPVLSFLFLTARCRDCGEKISWQYPLVEVVMGIIFAFIGNSFFLVAIPSSWLLTIFYLLVFSLLMVILVYDMKYMEIPMAVLWFGVALSVCWVLFYDWNQGTLLLGGSLLGLKSFSGLLGGAVAFGFFYALSYFSKETWMGYGDAYLGLLVGLIVGWPMILPALMLAFTIGAIVSVFLLAFAKKNMKSQVPFAPFLIAGAFLAVILPELIPAFRFFPFYF